MLRNLALPVQQYAPRSKIPPIEWHLQQSPLKRIPALRTVSGEWDSASVSATVATLEDACTDADQFETICQIRGRPHYLATTTRTHAFSRVRDHFSSTLYCAAVRRPSGLLGVACYALSRGRDHFTNALLSCSSVKGNSH